MPASTHSLRALLIALAALLAALGVLYTALTLMSGLGRQETVHEVSYEQKLEILSALRGTRSATMDQQEDTLSSLERGREMDDEQKMQILRGLK
jgi:hypothetical protein